MATCNTINPFLNYTLASDNANFSSKPSKNYLSSNFNYTLTVPKNIVIQASNIYERAIPTAAQSSSTSGTGSDQTLLGPLVLSGAEVVDDFASNIRETFKTYHHVYGTESPVELAALGFTTGFNLISGSLNVRNGLKEIKTAEKVSDVAGKQLAQLKVVKGAGAAAGGAIFIPLRALSLAALYTSSKVVSTLAGVLGSIGSACFNVVVVIAGIALGIKLNEHRLFRNELNAILDDPNVPQQDRLAKALEHLKKLATVSPEEKEAIRTELRALPENQTLTSNQLDAKVEEKSNLLLQKKEAYLKRVADVDCIKQIREKGPVEAKEVIEAVQKTSKEKVILASIAMGLCVVAVALTIAGFIFTGPLGIAIAAGVGLVASAGWLILDAYDLIKEFKESDPGRFDKLWIFLSSVLAIVTVALVFFLSAGTAPIVAAAIGGAVWLAINAACYYRLYQHSKKTES